MGSEGEIIKKHSGPSYVKLRLLHVIASADPASGGPIEGVLRQNEAIGERGEREIVSLDPPDAPFLSGLPIRIYPMGEPKRRWMGDGRISRFGYSRHLLPWLRRHIHNYDAIIVNGIWNYASVAASQVLPNSGVPYFVFSHGMLDPWFRTTYPLKHVQKQISWLLFEGRLVQHAEAVLFTTEEEQRLAEGQFWGHPYKGRVVGYGTTPPPPASKNELTAFQARVPACDTRPYLLFLSRIHEKKGCDLLIEAYARCINQLADLQLVIAGPDRDNLQLKLAARARTLGISDRVHWPGMLTGEAKWGALRGASAFILPSHQENFGIAVAEALACGIPVLTTNKVNIWREVEGGGAGLIAEDTVNGIESLLSRFLAMSPAQRAQMGIAGRTTFATHFDVRTTAKTLLDVICEKA